MIEFITTRKIEEKELTFDMVEKNQFFIDSDGWLFQKSSDNEFMSIADDEGIPTSVSFSRGELEGIRKILPKVYKIRWE